MSEFLMRLKVKFAFFLKFPHCGIVGNQGMYCRGVT